ncbi:ABC transporter permease [Bacteroides sp. 224]|uniref:ABC transporter permease n=1 Tax=Bacteroides sp. 224 TaxID=2302936 RepID=UPI0013D77DA6|nr:ABC transporter permease [Bacteroides sp. 224]NDV65530.1 ABC transporter permease [Bacteroides sp. 224]
MNKKLQYKKSSSSSPSPSERVGERLLAVSKRECRRLVSRPLYLFCMVIAPLFCYIFFTTLMDSGLPTNLPIAAVDLDNTSTSRNIIQNLDAFSQTAVVQRYGSVDEARNAMQRGEIYGFFYIPRGLSEEAQKQQQPKVSFYTNNSYLIAGSLLFRDMKMMSELASGAAARTVLYAKGATKAQAMAYLQPIVIDTHALNNPWLNYSVYLCNTLVPGVLMLMIFMITVYSIGVEIKDRTAREWLRMGNNSIYISLAGKLLPHTVIFFIMGIFYNAYLYGILHFPHNSGILPMIFATLLFILASQACGVFMVGVLPTLRLGLSFASLWGVISFSISGFTFPVMAMHPTLQALSNLFPLRHYFLIYVDQALNGYDMAYSWVNYVALLLFMMLPFLIFKRLKEALIYYKYMP